MYGAIEISFDQKFKSSAVQIPLHGCLFLIVFRIAGHKQIDQLFNFQTSHCYFLYRIENSRNGSVFLSGWEMVDIGDGLDDFASYELG